MGGEDAVGVAGGEEGSEEFVADGSGGLFDGLGIAVGADFREACDNVGLV